MRTLRNETGVTMVTVLLIGAVLTTVATTATVMTIQELKAGGADRRAAEALSYAEAGVDRLFLSLRRGEYNFGQVRQAGCTTTVTVSGIIGGDPNRTYSAKLEVYNPGATNPADRLPPAACTGRSENPRVKQHYAVTSEGRHPAARRVVRQIVTISALELPIGAYAERIDINGEATMQNITMLSKTEITGREKVGFKGLDPYYTKDDFYRNGNTSSIPAAAHAAGIISFVKGGKNTREHPPSPNCNANPLGDAGASLWDGDNWTTDTDLAKVSGTCTGQELNGFPPTSLFTPTDLARVVPRPDLTEQDYLTLKDAAKTSGLYCTPSGTGLSCLRLGKAVTLSKTIQDLDLGDLKKVTNFIAYFDFPSGDPLSAANTIKWNAKVEPCDDIPANSRSAIVLLRNSSLTMQSGAVVTGGLLVPEGRLDSEGSWTSHGTIIAKEFWIRGGALMQNSPCWVRNIPGPFLDLTPSRWHEVDR